MMKNDLRTPLKLEIIIDFQPLAKFIKKLSEKKVQEQ